MRLKWIERVEVISFGLSAIGFLVASIALVTVVSSSEENGIGTIVAFASFVGSGFAFIVGVAAQRVYVTRVIRGHSRMLDEVMATLRHDIAALAGLGLASEVVYEPAASGHRPNMDALRSMSSRALLAFLAEDFHRHVEGLNGITRQVERPMRLDGERLIGLAVRELERLLPAGCCWLGVTKISGEEWHENRAIYDFHMRSRVRVKQEQLTMFVIYAFDTGSTEIRNQMREDDGMGVDVRLWDGSIDSIDDISLILEPAGDSSQRAVPPATINDVRDCYRPLCLLRFSVANGGLREMTGYRGQSVEFQRDLVRFDQWWQASQSIENNGA